MIELSEYIKKKTEKRPVYMPYLTVGDPGFDETYDYAIGMIDAGADILELGIPFSDPTADGPVIQKAMVRAMARDDFSIENVFGTMKRIHDARPEIPIVILTYLNLVMNAFPGYSNSGEAGTYEKREVAATLAMENFLKKSQEAGVRGIVIPDLPHHQLESEILFKKGKPFGIDRILMVAPTTSPQRRKEICKNASGFIYYVTSTGVTGVRKELPSDMKKKIAQVKKDSGVPVIAGFGFNDPDQMRGLHGAVDGVIVGSHNHRVIEERGDQALQELISDTEKFVSALSQ